MRLASLLISVTTAALVAGCAIPSPQPGHRPPPQASGPHGPGPGAPGHPGAAAPRPPQHCDPRAAQWAVGKTNTEHTIAEARKRSGAYIARVLRPGQPTTREFNAERLNLEVDASGRIVAARCG